MRLAAAILAFLPIAGIAQVLAPQYPGGYQPEFDEDKPWQEQKLSLPAYPNPQNLVQIKVGPTASFDFFVDKDSISIGKDGVIRYTLVARSSSGAENVSYEGIRCSSRQRKLYAFGHRDNSWSQARRSEWQDISMNSASPQHAVLADDYFCPRRIRVRTREEAVQALLRGGNPTAAGAPDSLNQPY